MKFVADLTLPNILSSFRIVAAPAMLGFAFAGSRLFFIAFFSLALLSDSIDGLIARRRHTTTVTGARLDSLGDLMIVLTLLPSVWLLWPETVIRESAYIAVGLVSYLVPTCIGMIKFKRMPSYHTIGAKTMAVLFGISLFLIFLDITPLLFRICIPLAVIESIEEIAITLTLPEWRSDVLSIFHAVKIRKQVLEKALKES